MNTLINGLNRGLGFAIPINLANEIGQQLIAGQRIIRPWLGIRIETLGEDQSLRDLFKASTRASSSARSKPTRRPIKATCARSTSSPTSTARQSIPTHNCNARF
jgi:hypothetical protein